MGVGSRAAAREDDADTPPGNCASKTITMLAPDILPMEHARRACGTQPVSGATSLAIFTVMQKQDIDQF